MSKEILLATDGKLALVATCWHKWRYPNGTLRLKGHRRECETCGEVQHWTGKAWTTRQEKRHESLH